MEPTSKPVPLDAKPIGSIYADSVPIARIVDQHCDIALVGDSVGMVVHGLPSTLPVTLDRADLRPLPVQLADALRGLVLDGWVPPGDPLPSTRSWARAAW